MRFIAVFSLLSLSSAVSAQACAKTFGPMGPEIRPSETLAGDQVTSRAARASKATDFNVRIRSGIDSLLVPGATISTRWYYRDPHDSAGYGTGLTDALRFAICP